MKTILQLLIKLWPYIAAMIPGIIFGTFIGFYPGYKVFEFVWEDERFCFGCHVHDYANSTWKDSSHGKLTTCHDCHHQPLRSYIKEALKMVTHNPTFPKDMGHFPHIDNHLCEACHHSNPHDKTTISGPLAYEEVKNIPKVDNLYLHKVHLGIKTKLPPNYTLHLQFDKKVSEVDKRKLDDKERDIACVDCHGGLTNQGHNFSASDKSCMQCHKDELHKDLNPEFKEAMSCRNCHFLDFLVPLKKRP